jgi:hypothetical protein
MVEISVTRPCSRNDTGQMLITMGLNVSTKKFSGGETRCGWLITVVLATWETEIRRILVPN